MNQKKNIHILLVLAILLVNFTFSGSQKVNNSNQPRCLFEFQAFTSPIGNFINMESISTPYESGCRIDTTDSLEYGYYFMGIYQGVVLANNLGEIHISGFFRQEDLLDFYDEELSTTNRFVQVFLFNSNNPDFSYYDTSYSILTYDEGEDWLFKDITIRNLTANNKYYLGIGRIDSWEFDWELAVEWANITIYNEVIPETIFMPQASSSVETSYALTTSISSPDGAIAGMMLGLIFVGGFIVILAVRLGTRKKSGKYRYYQGNNDITNATDEYMPKQKIGKNQCSNCLVDVDITDVFCANCGFKV